MALTVITPRRLARLVDNSARRKLVIINADDLGFSESVNEEIFSLMDNGFVTSATLLANGPAFDNAARRLKRYPGCSFGVHLNLTAFRPITFGPFTRYLVGNDGDLCRRNLRALPRPAAIIAARQELIAQVQRVVRAGIPISHFDSHHHLHTHPAFFVMLKSLQRMFGVKKVRSRINLLPPSTQAGVARSFRKALFHHALRNVVNTVTTDILGDFRDFHAHLMRHSLPRFHSAELMVHPGARGEKYVKETHLLKSEWQRDIPGSCELGSYNDL